MPSYEVAKRAPPADEQAKMLAAKMAEKRSNVPGAGSRGALRRQAGEGAAEQAWEDVRSASDAPLYKTTPFAGRRYLIPTCARTCDGLHAGPQHWTTPSGAQLVPTRCIWNASRLDGQNLC